MLKCTHGFDYKLKEVVKILHKGAVLILNTNQGFLICVTAGEDALFV